MCESTNAALLQAILDSAVDGIITIDERGIMRSANSAAERIFGHSAAEMIGSNVSMLMPGPYRAEHDGYLERYRRTGERKIIGIGREVRGLRKDGSTFPMQLGVSEVRDGDTRLFSGIVQDITTRRNLEDAREALIEQLETANAELERFTYTVSHDLKSPLITIKGFLGLLEQDAVAGNLDRLRADISRIGAAADKMKRLLDELLELSRIGRVAHPDEDVDMNVLVAETLQMVAGAIDQAKVQVTVASDLPTVRGDRVRLGEVWQNLLENAVKFMRSDVPGAIAIDWRKSPNSPEMVEFRIEDNGVGIDARYLDRVFRLFEQLDGHLEGTGIGLALVKRIIEIHGGKIWVESRGLGHGSTFRFSLPRIDELEDYDV